MLDQLRPALIIARREVRDQFRDWRIIFPIIILTVFFPFLMNFTAREMVNFANKYGASLIADRLVPFLMMIVGFFPISFSLVIALESFVGEKERGSIEPLLNTPLKDWQLYIGKLLSSTVPPLLGSFLGITVYSIGLYRNHVPLPETSMMIQIIALTIVQALMMVSGAVVVSTQATSVRAANLLASFIVIPSALLIQGESIVMFWGNYDTLWWVVFGIMILALLLARVGMAQFRREELLGRELDALNIHWMLRTFAAAFRGKAHNFREWYRVEVLGTFRQLGLPILAMSILVVAGVILGAMQTERFLIPLEDSGLQDMEHRLVELAKTWPVGNFVPVLLIFWQNIRVFILSMILGVFSFGVLGVMPMMLTMGVSGYLMGLLSCYGMSPWVYFAAFILPHGIIEIPAAVIAGAAVLRMGAILAKPTQGRTIGEIWLGALADWMKVFLGLAAPLLLAAAMIEAWITPRLALWLF